MFLCSKVLCQPHNTAHPVVSELVQVMLRCCPKEAAEGPAGAGEGSSGTISASTVCQRGSHQLAGYRGAVDLDLQIHIYVVF